MTAAQNVDQADAHLVEAITRVNAALIGLHLTGAQHSPVARALGVAREQAETALLWVRSAQLGGGPMET